MPFLKNKRGDVLKAVLATKNRHKTGEVKALLSRFGLDIELLTLSDIGFNDEIIENGTTFEENALIKCRAVSKKYDGIIVADDSGLCVDALNGEPGIYSARYAGDGNDDSNNKKLLEKMKDVPREKRTARFVCAFAAIVDGKEYVVRGECEGIIATEKRGSGDFGYDPLFEYEPMNMTFAEMTENEKNSVSHRANALKSFAELMNSIK